MTTPVIFPIAKLLKEKGFDEPCNHVHYEHKLYSYTKRGGVKNSDKKEQQWICTAPTISEVVMWLYEKYGIWISIHSDKAFNWESLFSIKIDWIYPEDSPDSEDIEPKYYKYKGKNEFNAPTEAYETAIEYTLKNFIL